MGYQSVLDTYFTQIAEFYSKFSFWGSSLAKEIDYLLETFRKIII